MNLQALIDANNARWKSMRVKTQWIQTFAKVAARLGASDAMTQYRAITKRTNVPAEIIAVIHEREASQKWDRSIAQGDPWNKVSVHVPKGRGPFHSFEDAAFDALVNCAPYAAKWKDWSAGGALTLLETYNGLGYAKRGLPSPYIWSGTDQYIKGKYTSDGVFDKNAVDQQTGCAGLLVALGWKGL